MLEPIQTMFFGNVSGSGSKATMRVSTAVYGEELDLSMWKIGFSRVASVLQHNWVPCTRIVNRYHRMRRIKMEMEMEMRIVRIG